MKFVCLVLALLLVSCAPSTVSTQAQSHVSAAPSPSSPGIMSLTSLRDAAIAAGYSCPNWHQENDTSGNCSGLDVFMFFTDQADRSESYTTLSKHVKNGIADAVLFGPMWAINGNPAELQSVQPKLGGELLLNPTAKPRPKPKRGSSCTSPRGNSKLADLIKASVKLDGAHLTARFEFAARPPVDVVESFGVFISAANYAAGTGSYQLGVTWLNGTRGPFIMDMGTAMQENYPASDVTIDGKVVSVRFDATPFRQMGDGWQWRAAVAADGADVDSCPGGVGDFLVYA